MPAILEWNTAMNNHTVESVIRTQNSHSHNTVCGNSNSIRFSYMTIIVVICYFATVSKD